MVSPRGAGHGAPVGGVAANDDGTDRERVNRGNAPLEHRWLLARLPLVGQRRGRHRVGGGLDQRVERHGRRSPGRSGASCRAGPRPRSTAMPRATSTRPRWTRPGHACRGRGWFRWWAVDLVTGQVASTDGPGEGVTALWTSAPYGGRSRSWGGEVLGATRRAFSAPSSLPFHAFRRLRSWLSETLLVTCTRGSVRLEGVYAHGSNLDTGVRVWPAVRSGNAAARHFVEQAGRMLDALDTLRPRSSSSPRGRTTMTTRGSLVGLMGAVRERAPEADLAVWSRPPSPPGSPWSVRPPAGSGPSRKAGP